MNAGLVAQIGLVAFGTVEVSLLGAPKLAAESGQVESMATEALEHDRCRSAALFAEPVVTLIGWIRDKRICCVALESDTVLGEHLLLALEIDGVVHVVGWAEVGGAQQGRLYRRIRAQVELLTVARLGEVSLVMATQLLLQNLLVAHGPGHVTVLGTLIIVAIRCGCRTGVGDRLPCAITKARGEAVEAENFCGQANGTEGLHIAHQLAVN